LIVDIDTSSYLYSYIMHIYIWFSFIYAKSDFTQITDGNSEERNIHMYINIPIETSTHISMSLNV